MHQPAPPDFGRAASYRVRCISGAGPLRPRFLTSRFRRFALLIARLRTTARRAAPALLVAAVLLLSACDSIPSSPDEPAVAPPQIEAFSYQPDTVRAGSLPADAFPDSTTARVPLTLEVTTAGPGAGDAVGVQYVIDRPRARETLTDGTLAPVAPDRYRAADTLALPVEDARYRVLIFATGSTGRLGDEAQGTLFFLAGDSTEAP